MIGGFERATGAASTAEVERYDVERDGWTRVAAMPVALNHAAATAYRCDVYVVGGYRGDRALAPEVRTLYRYDPERNRWRRLPSAPTKRAGGRRDRHCLCAARGASSRAGAFATLEIYDFRSRR